MTNINLKHRLLSLFVVLAILVCTLPLAAIVGFAADEAAECLHIDEDMDALCDICEGFLDEPVGELTLGEEITADLPFMGEGFLYFSFTPAESGYYMIKTVYTEIDPLVYLYESTGEYVNYDDDDGRGSWFRLEEELYAGNTYHIALASYYNETVSNCTFLIKPSCSEHTPSGAATCLGTFCSVCEEYYGDEGDHIPLGAATCLGTFCSVCEEYYGDEGDHTPLGAATCLGTFCSVCEEYYGDEGDHIPLGAATCLGTLCAVCENYYGDPSGDHVDENNDFKCDRCACIVDGIEIGVGTYSIPLVAGGYAYYKFTPSESSYYSFKSNSQYDPRLNIFDKNGNCIADGDDEYDYNFSFVTELVAGETYYLEFYEYDSDNSCRVDILKLCDVHTPVGGLTCLGTLCSVCGIYYGEKADHVYTELEYDQHNHWCVCDFCEYYTSSAHLYDEDGVCECGYFIHECVFDRYSYDTAEHCMACSLCNIADTDTLEYHEYDENGVCICGREKFTDGIYLGTVLLTDGQYLDNDGNLSAEKPEGGYAYYNDGVLTLNGYELSVEDDNPFDQPTAIYSELDLSIILIGDSELISFGEDVITVRFADLTVSGDGTLLLKGERIDVDGGYAYGDGIDLTFGDLTVNGGMLDIFSSDHGIEIDYGNLTVNGGEIYIDAEDEGIDITGGDLTLNDGSIDIHADDKGIDIGGNMTVNGGIAEIFSDDDGIEVSEDLRITDGKIDVHSESIGIEVSGEVTIIGAEVEIFALSEGLLAYGNVTLGGIFEISAELGGVVSFGNILLGNVIFAIETDDGMYAIKAAAITVEGEQDNVEINQDSDVEGSYSYIDGSYFGLGEYVDKNILMHKDFTVRYDYVYTGEEISIELYSELSLGVDYILQLPEDAIKELGIYEVKIVGIGDYVGEISLNIGVHKGFDLPCDESIDLNVSGYEDEIWTLVSFTPEYDGTYEFFFSCNNRSYVNLLDSDFAYNPLGSYVGEFKVTLELIGGVTYYFDVYSDVKDALCTVSARFICNDHVGGEATYHEQAVCDRCGEHYGDLLVCDHMCHADGIRGYIWKIFEFIYDFIGIESECKCGVEH